MYRIVTGVTSDVGVPSTYLVTSIIKCGIKLIIHSQTSVAQPLKFGNGEVILCFHTLLGM